MREFHLAVLHLDFERVRRGWIWWRLNCPHTQFTASNWAGCGTSAINNHIFGVAKLLILIWRCCWQAKELIIQVHVVCFLADRKAGGVHARSHRGRADPCMRLHGNFKFAHSRLLLWFFLHAHYGLKSFCTLFLNKFWQIVSSLHISAGVWTVAKILVTYWQIKYEWECIATVGGKRRNFLADWAR